jgi:hypothetical protein
VTPEDGVVIINHEGSARPATSIGPRTYLIETNAPDGTRVSFEYTLDGAGLSESWGTNDLSTCPANSMQARR